ncbi:hypothetical protein [Streptomyces blattellae]|uniref:hypothetical protein n=1 Tax=Streptomyces blattellae TaxID=2569855 RepID=UPI0012B8D681|nr:hypothetical protein [Streptomyces blattellae]
MAPAKFLERVTRSELALSADASLRAGGSVVMSPTGLDVILPANADWKAGDLGDFALHFEHSGAVRVPSVVVRPGGDGATSPSS